ncbi:hypothetical protein [Streptomyces sp. 16-176A]
MDVLIRGGDRITAFEVLRTVTRINVHRGNSRPDGEHGRRRTAETHGT